MSAQEAIHQVSEETILKESVQEQASPKELNNPIKKEDNSESTEMSPMLQAELANKMKMMQTLVMRQREIEKELDAKGGNENTNALSEVLSCIRGLIILFNDKMNALPGASCEVKKIYDSFKGATQEAKANLDDLFSIDNVKNVIQMADGYSPHLSSPEKAIRMLISKSFESLKEPSETCVKEVGKILSDAVAEVLNDMQGDRTKEYPELTNACVELAADCIGAWERDSVSLAKKLILIEQNAPDHKFFRDLAQERLKSYESIEPKTVQENKPQTKEENGDGKSNEYLMGFLEKRTHKSQKWQNRWFVLSESRRVLYYFMHPDSLKPCASIPLDDVEVIELVNTPRTTKYGPESACKIFRLRNTDSSKSILPHKANGQPRSLTIRAPNPQSKQEWVDAIQKCSRKYWAVEEESAEAQDDGVDAQDSVSNVGSEQELERQDAFKKEDYEPEQEDKDLEEHCDDVKSIVSIQSSFKHSSSFKDGRTLHLVVPFVPSIDSYKSPEDAYLHAMATSTRKYVEDIFTQLMQRIPKSISFTLVDECKKKIEGKISEGICSFSELDLQTLIGKDPAAVEQIITLKTELTQVKVELDALLTMGQGQEAED